MGLFPDSNQSATSIVAKLLNRGGCETQQQQQQHRQQQQTTDVSLHRGGGIVVVTSNSNTSAMSSDSQRSPLMALTNQRSASKNMQLLSTSWEFIK